MMRAASLISFLFSIAACSNEPAAQPDIDVNAAAARAEDDIANYAAVTDKARSAQADAAPARPAAPASPPSNSAAPPAADRTDPAEGSDAAAAAVVRDYFAAIAARRYRDAWALWRDGGKGSGMSAEAFARDHARYASIAAEVGVPGDADAGAGQRYITVPVTAAGTLASGGRFVLQGPIVLHRVADGIGTSDPAAHRWRIDRSDLKPRPDAARAADHGAAAATAARYRCGEGATAPPAPGAAAASPRISCTAR